MSTPNIAAFKEMATNPVTKKLLIKDDTCIGGLVMVLSNPDEGIVKTALETLQLLADTVRYRSHLHDFIGMQDQLNLLLKSQNKELQGLAHQLQKTLQDKQPLKDRHNRSRTPRRNRVHYKNEKGIFVSNIGRAKTVILHIKGLKDRRDLEICRNHLLEVKGVISITFDMVKKRAVVRTKLELQEEALGRAISKSDAMYAELVIKGDDGEEQIVPFGAAAEDKDKENQSLPQYLPDEDSPVKDQAIARVGEEKKSSGWLKTAASYLSNALYW